MYVFWLQLHFSFTRARRLHLLSSIRYIQSLLLCFSLKRCASSISESVSTPRRASTPSAFHKSAFQNPFHIIDIITNTFQKLREHDHPVPCALCVPSRLFLPLLLRRLRCHLLSKHVQKIHQLLILRSLDMRVPDRLFVFLRSLLQFAVQVLGP